MSKVIINIKTDSKLKSEAQKLADNLGVSVSQVLNEALKRFVRERKFVVEESYEPSEYLKKSIKKSLEEYKKGEYIEFKDIGEATTYVDKLIADEAN